MPRSQAKLALSVSRDIPFDKLVLSQSNVRRIKAGVGIEDLAEDIARRTLLQSLTVRAVVGEDGQPTDRYEVQAGGRRYRALKLLVKQKRLAKNAPVPCIVQTDGVEEEDSLAENTMREALHPLDQYRAFKDLHEKGLSIDDIAARFFVGAQVVRQRLKLASVCEKLLALYAEDELTLDQLMAFTVTNDHARQEQVWEMLAHSYNKSAAYIRQRLTENSVRVADKRVRFVTIDTYVAAGGGVMRDLFEDDDGGWLTDPGLLDTLVADKLRQAGEDIAAEGWKWVATAVDMPWAVTNGHREISGTEVAMTEAEQARLAALQGESDEIEAQWADERDVPQDVYDRLDAINVEIGKLADRPLVFEPADVAIAGVFVSIERDGSLCVERGYVRPEDEPAADPVPDGTEHELVSVDGDTGSARPVGTDGDGHARGEDDEEGDEGLKPLPDRLVADLTAWRTLALQDALAQNPATAFAAVLHALVLQTCYFASRESCLQLVAQDVSFANPPSGLRDSAPARSLAERARYWEERLPESDADLWEALLALNGDEQAALFAHCASRSVNAQCEIVPKYDNGRVSKHSIERRLAHSHVLARAVGLDPVAAGWRPTVDGYFRSVTKPRILADVTEARGEQFAGMIDHLKKADMAREAERLLEDAQWLPEPLRTPPACEAEPGDMDSDALPAFLENEDGAYAIAAE